MKVQSMIDLPPGSRQYQALRQALIATYLERIVQIIEATRSMVTAIDLPAPGAKSRTVDHGSDLGYAVDIACIQE